MSAQQSAWTPSGRVILSAASSAVERELIQEWASRQVPPSVDEIVDLRDQLLADRLRTGDDPLLVPVGVAWLPKERNGVRQAGWPDLLTFRDPRNPSRRRQERIAEHDAEGYRIVVGEPARVSELRSRFAKRFGDARSEPLALAGFVVRQATLALERAERAVIGERYKIPRLVVEEIGASTQFQGRVRALAGRIGMSPDKALSRSTSALHELAAVQSRLFMDLFTIVMRPLHARAWNVRVEGSDLDSLRELNRKHALIFLPSHRSYADPLVLADALFDHDFPRNHVVAGDNLAFFPLGPLARRAGVVFMRRSFRDDEIYKLAIQEYFAYLVTKRFNLEWYFEGGRSRTGKLRPPKYGLLRYVAGALLADPTLDVYLVPVSITYERLFEAGDMAAEQDGWVKPPEGLAALARFARGQSEPSGDAVVRFGRPFAMRAGLPGSDDDDDALKLALNKIAFEVAVGINSATPILPASLVTLALLGVRDRALTLDQVRHVLDPVLDYVKARGLPESGVEGLRRADHLDTALHELEKAKVLTFYGGGEAGVYAISPGQHLVAAFYRNNAIHWFVNRAILELSMIAASENAAPKAKSPADAAPAAAAPAAAAPADAASAGAASDSAPAGAASDSVASDSAASNSAASAGAAPDSAVPEAVLSASAVSRASGSEGAVPEDAVLEGAVPGGAGSGGAVAVEGATLEAGWEEALRLRDLLKYEFFFPDKAAFREELAVEIDLIDPGWRSRQQTPEGARRLLTDSGFLMAHRVLRSFLEAELVVALRLLAHPVGDEVDRKAFLSECAGVGRQYLLQGRVRSAEALSRELFASALKLAEGRGLLTPGAPDLAERRQAFADELQAVVRRVQVAADIDAGIERGTT